MVAVFLFLFFAHEDFDPEIQLFRFVEARCYHGRTETDHTRFRCTSTFTVEAV